MVAKMENDYEEGLTFCPFAKQTQTEVVSVRGKGKSKDYRK